MTPAPSSRTQIEKLGVRLVERTPPDQDDVAALHLLLAGYGTVLDRAVDRVCEELGVAPSARIKNTGTILEKLHRYGGSWLKSLQDLAGMRIVGMFDLNGQDALVAQLVALFASEQRPPKVVDRREAPVQGYRAVHVIVFPEGVPVEIQVRTRLQHEWAELFEKLADRVGRGVRYGEPPRPSSNRTSILAGIELTALTKEVSEIIALYETAERVVVVDLRLARAQSRIEEALNSLSIRLAALEPPPN